MNFCPRKIREFGGKRGGLQGQLSYGAALLVFPPSHLFTGSRGFERGFDHRNKRSVATPPPQTAANPPSTRSKTPSLTSTINLQATPSCPVNTAVRSTAKPLLAYQRAVLTQFLPRRPLWERWIWTVRHQPPAFTDSSCVRRIATRRLSRKDSVWPHAVAFITNAERSKSTTFQTIECARALNEENGG